MFLTCSLSSVQLVQWGQTFNYPSDLSQDFFQRTSYIVLNVKHCPFSCPGTGQGTVSQEPIGCFGRDNHPDQKCSGQERQEKSEYTVFSGEVVVCSCIFQILNIYNSQKMGLYYINSASRKNYSKNFNQKIFSFSLCPEIMHSHSILSTNQSMLGHQ